MITQNMDGGWIVFGIENSLIYTNHRNEKRVRTVIPLCLRWGTGPAYPTNRWLLEVFDVEKHDYRTYDLAWIELRPTTTKEPWKCADASNRQTDTKPETSRPKQDTKPH